MTVLIAGLSVGAIYAIVALGYNITYLAGGVVNFAFAGFLMVAAFLWTWVREATPLPAAFALIVVALVVGCLGVVEERLTIRPLATGTHSELITTFGVATILTGIMLVVWGVEPRPVPPVFPDLTIDTGGVRFTVTDLVLIGAAVLVALLLHLVTPRLRVGLAALAQTENRSAAVLRGVDVHRLSAGAFGAAMVFAGLIGPVVAMKTFAVPTAAFLLAIKGIVALTIGGIGNHLGALAGGFLVGLFEVTTARFLDAGLQDLVVFGVFLVVVLVRPRGILAARKVRTV